MSATNRGSERKAYDFYATPPETIRAFLANFDGISSGDRILEPSAGNGQIVKVLRESGYDNRIDAVELRPEERDTLEALADNVTISSFFDYEPDCSYDFIISIFRKNTALASITVRNKAKVPRTSVRGTFAHGGRRKKQRGKRNSRNGEEARPRPRLLPGTAPDWQRTG